MRSLLFILFTLFIVTASAQTDNSDTLEVSEITPAWKNLPDHAPLKRGFYKTYGEFLTNSPSQQRNFTLVDKTKSDKRKGKGICAVNYHLADGEEKVGHVWGFCDGNAVYFRANRAEGKYWKLDYIGPYSFFVHVAQVRSLATALVAGAIGTREFSVVNSSGKMVEAIRGYMKKILKQCPGLDEEYDKEKDKGDEEVKIKYLIRLNEYLTGKKG